MSLDNLKPERDAAHGLVFDEERAIGNLFHGIFLGNNQVLLRTQVHVLERLTPTQWDHIRENIAISDINIEKAGWRLELYADELYKFKAAALILCTPPSYDEALAVLRARVEKEDSLPREDSKNNLEQKPI